MIVNILIIVVALVAVLYGADRLTEGACAIARRMGISSMVVGLTVVAFGTSMPEFCVSMTSALSGSADIAVGNIVGSNIFNALFIVGLASIIAPLTVLPATVRRDVPMSLLASALLVAFALNGTISRLEAGVLLLVFAAYMTYTIRKARKEDSGAEDAEPAMPMGAGKAVAMVVAGLALLVVGSEFFVKSAVSIATRLGVSEAVIGLTIVACGTSLPELATSCVAAYKGRCSIAIGNVVGSNVFNILFIVGGTGLVCPMEPQGLTVVDYGMLVVCGLLLLVFAATKLKVERWEGVTLTLVFLAYMAWLVTHAA